jgi:hypothetical protein
MPTGQRASAEGKEPVQRAREPVQRAREPVQPGKEANAKDHEPVPKGQDASATEPDARATESQTPPSKARCHHSSGEMPPPKDARCLHQRCQMPQPKQPEASPRANFRPAQNRYSSLLAVCCEAEEKINDKSANTTPTNFFLLKQSYEAPSLAPARGHLRQIRATTSGHPNPMAYSATCLPQVESFISPEPFQASEYYSH